LVVVAIIALLAAILMPTLEASKDQVRLLYCGNSLRHMITANVLYATDNNAFTVHGIDMGYANWPVTAYDRRFYPTYIFDDDWWDAQPGTPGRNPDSNGAQNFCPIAQLMLGGYVPRDYRVLACPQADHREQTPYHYGVKYYRYMPYSWAWNYNAKGCIESNWDPDAYHGNPSYAYLGTTYVVRGPLMRVHEVNPATFAFFGDHEQAAQTLIPEVPNGASPLPGWGRTHKGGINCAYLDGHVQLYPDENRAHTYWWNYTRYYGNGWCIGYGGYDR
jgi:prepilin-type processing-associated H-X9-DG protein